VADAEQPWEGRLRDLIATAPRDRESLGEDVIGSAAMLDSPNHIATKLRVVRPEERIERRPPAD